MFEKSQDILRLSVAAAAILIGGSVAYHYAIYIPEKDQEAQQNAAAKEAAEERRDEAQNQAAAKSAEEKRTAYKLCVSDAQMNYESRWNSNCKSLADDAAENRSTCNSRGYDASYCAAMYPPVPAEHCRLPSSNADSYDDQLKDEKARCLAEASNGLESPL
jgi:hypothetical protein